MFNMENGKKAVKLGYLINVACACLNLLVTALWSFDVLDGDIASALFGLVQLGGIVGAIAVVGGFVIMWMAEKQILHIAIPGVYVATFVLGFFSGFVPYIAYLLNVAISIIALGEYAVWALLIKEKNNNFALGLFGVAGISFIMILLNFTGMLDYEITTTANVLFNCAGMGLCFLSANQME